MFPLNDNNNCCYINPFTAKYSFCYQDLLYLVEYVNYYDYLEHVVQCRHVLSYLSSEYRGGLLETGSRDRLQVPFFRLPWKLSEQSLHGCIFFTFVHYFLPNFY